MKAIILCAGYATRLYPLTQNCPKALLPVGGKTMLDHLMEKVAPQREIDEVHLVTNHLFAQAFTEWAQAARDRYPNLRLQVWDDGTTSNENRLGALGDVNFVLEQAKIDDDLFVAASDNLFFFSLDPFFQAFQHYGDDMIFAMPISDIETLRRFAVASIDDTGRVTDLVEKPQNPRSPYGVSALYLYRRDTLPLFRQYLAEGNAPDAPGHFPEWLYTRRTLRAFISDGELIDIGTVETYREICARFE